MKSENILKVIEVFKKVLPMAKSGGLDMMQTLVYANNPCDKHSCGTVHCAAGWYFIGKMGITYEFTTYDDGVELMCEDLGFVGTKFDASQNPLSDWARDNELLWGNIYGGACFSSPLAYKGDSRPNGAENLQHIIDHWTEVYERVRATEQPQQPAYENISKSLAVLPVSETSDVINQPVNEML